MRSTHRRCFALATAAILAACGGSSSDAPDTQAGQPSAGPIPEGAEMPADHPPVGQMPADHPDLAEGAPAAGGQVHQGETRTGTVLEAQVSAGYTYLRMDIDGDEIWVAGPRSPVQVGDEITISGLMGMENFYSRSLDRTFDRILFASVMTRG